jgi:type I restriction enzyme S subunit
MVGTKSTKAFYNTEIPDEWEELKLKDIGKITSGTTPLRSNLAFHYAGTIPWVKTTDLNNSVILKTEEQITELALKENSLRIYPKETVLVAMYGGFNQIGRTGILGIEATINQALSAITIDKSEVDSTYLLNWLNGKVGLWKNLAGSSRKDPNITSKDVGDFPFLKPPLPEQKAIARVLSTADAAIHSTEKLIAQKELRKKWLMQQLLTGKKRLKGFEGEWRKLGAGEIFRSITKKGFANEELLSATQDRGMIPRTMLEGRVTMPTTGTEGFKLVEIGDFVISLRSFQGGLEYSYYRGLVSPAYTVLKPKTPINEEFYKQYFKSSDFIGHLSIAVIGIRDGKQISFDDFCTVKIPYPTIAEQTAIAQVLQAADKEISLLKAIAEKLREQKKGLMQLLLTGKVRLKIINETK